jgi:hypothetical protein
MSMQVPLSMKAMEGGPITAIATKLEKAREVFISALKKGNPKVIKAATIALIIFLVAAAGKQFSGSEGFQQVPQKLEETLSPELVEEYVMLLDNYKGNPQRFIEILEQVIKQRKLLTVGVVAIGESRLAQNPANKKILQQFFLDISNISRLYLSKEAASKALNLFGQAIGPWGATIFMRAIQNSNLPQQDPFQDIEALESLD